MELAAVNSPATALVAGLVTSLHCAGMCGPLACLLAPARGERADAQTVSSVYHLSRLAGYALLGAVAGAAGRMPLTLLGGEAVRYLPWVLVIFFVLVAVRLDQRLPRLALLGRMQFKLQQWLRGRSRIGVAAAMGAATPLLPCGPLYFLVALAALSGSAARGVEFMLAFGLGTVPLLWLAQANAGWIRTKLTPTGLRRTQAGLALVTALVLSWRLRGTLGFEGPDAGTFLCF
jgi:sulfite exporter TauE/SafE